MCYRYTQAFIGLARVLRIRYAAPMGRIFFVILLTFILIAPETLADQRRLIQISAGTGFFINRQGKIITNAHVVQSCKSIVVRVPRGDLPATIVARDEGRDLAVLQVNSNEVPALASFRWNIDDVRLGDEVAILGYPGQEGALGRATFVKTKVIGMVGPYGESGFLQLASVVKRGNSGGPVLDSSGNVIGVVTGFIQELKEDTNGRVTGEPVRQVDIAITLAALREFLQKHQISFYQVASSGTGYGDRILQENAAQFIVPIRCIQGTKPVT